MNFTPYWRVGIYDDNDDAKWPRAEKVPAEQQEVFLAEIRKALNRSLRTGVKGRVRPATETKKKRTAREALEVRDSVELHLGAKWMHEDNEWIRRTCDTLIQEFTADEIKAIEEAFPLPRDTAVGARGRNR